MHDYNYKFSKKISPEQMSQEYFMFFVQCMIRLRSNKKKFILGKVKHTIICVTVNFSLGKSMTQLVLETCIDCTSLDFLRFLFKYLFTVTCLKSTIENIFYHSSPFLSLHADLSITLFIVILYRSKILSSSLWQK